MARTVGLTAAGAYLSGLTALGTSAVIVILETSTKVRTRWGWRIRRLCARRAGVAMTM